MTAPVLYLKNVSFSFGGKELFNDIDLMLYPGDKCALVGRNGEGKSTLLKLVCEEIHPDIGTYWKAPGLRIGYLPQNNKEEVEAGLSTLQYLQKAQIELLEGEDVSDKQYKIDQVAGPLGVDYTKTLDQLSGGELKRVQLAKALLDHPDVLLLDEPTNHLDISTIEWLESFIASYNGSLVCISHDRTFLGNISNRMIWVDRGKIWTVDRSYKEFDKWYEQILEQENKELDRLKRKLSEEELWKQQGITARRKRNQRRLRELYDLRQKLRSAKARSKQHQQEIASIDYYEVKKSKLLAELTEVTFSLGNRKLVDNFTCTIAKGDKIGIVGPNGVGKSTLLKLILGQIQPDSGKVWLAKHIEVTYYDQMRSDLDPEETLWKTLCPSGGDHVKVGDKFMHVVGYLKNFMFDPKIARDAVATLSGGQANRLMLAKVLASPGTLLILDEPTNDLDVETLDMLQEILTDYSGTLLIVSHDRDFLDRVVTKSLVFEGDGKIIEYYGSYLEYRKERQEKQIRIAKKDTKPNQKIIETVKEEKPTNKLSYKHKWELDNLPKEIEELELKIADLETRLADPSLYEDSVQLNLLVRELNESKNLLTQKWERWNELENLA